MAKANKAHTATANRLVTRYAANLVLDESDPIDVQGPTIAIAVETTATVVEGVAKLRKLDGPVYIAMTNQEGVQEALRLVSDTGIGVMDPMGNIIRPAQPPDEDTGE